MSENATADTSTIIDPIDRLEFLMCDPRFRVYLSRDLISGEHILNVTRTDQSGRRSYTGLRLRDAINNLWEHERP